MQALFDFINRWLNLLSLFVGCIGGMGGLFIGLVAYQPLATKTYVQAVIDARLEPITHQLSLAAADTQNLDSKLNALTDATLSYQSIQLSVMATRLKVLIDTGLATDSDRQLYFQIQQELAREQQIRTQN